jgi:hypothetical protein
VHSTLALRLLRTSLLTLLSLSWWASPAAAQGVLPPGGLQSQHDRRVHWGIAAGPALEVATAGDREAERGVVAAPFVGVRVASWFEYVVEAHAARYVSPVGGTIAGVVPLGWRIHGRGRTQPYISMGAGIVWTNYTDLRGLDRRRNYLTQVGGGIRRVTARVARRCRSKRGSSTCRTSARRRRTSGSKGSPCWSATVRARVGHRRASSSRSVVDQ